jgi:replicative DNA helicase
MQQVTANIDAEQATLGSMLISREACAQGIELLTREDFYRPAHGEIFDALATIFAKDLPLDPIALIDELRDRGKLDTVGGAEYVAFTLTTQVPSASRIEHYAGMVRDKSRLRQLGAAGRSITELGLAEDAEPDDAYGRAVELLLALAPERSRRLRHIRDVLLSLYDEMGNRKTIPTVGTGIGGLDWMIGGIQSGLTLVAARPSMGKTALLLQIVRRMKSPALVFSLETSAEAIARRLICAKTEISTSTLRSTKVAEEDLTRITAAMADLYSLDLYVHDNPVEVGQLAALAKRAVLQYGVQMILVDYIQLVRTRGRFDTREQQVSTIARMLKELAQELKLPVLAAAQLSRATERREGKIPELQDLRESGELEAAADVAILIHNPRPDADDEGKPRPATLYVAKQRDGPTGAVQCLWHASALTFYESTDREEE